MFFLPYQKRWIDDESPLKLYEKSRRIGITYATAFRCVLKCLREPPGSHFVQWVSSRDEATARAFITDYVALWTREADLLSRDLAEGSPRAADGVTEKGRAPSVSVVRFRNGARICSLSSNPLAFAGKGGDVLIDEMDLHPDPETLYAMAFPCTTWGGQLEIVSAYSADGSDRTLFARLCAEAAAGNPRGFSFHRTTIDDAIAAGFVDKINAAARRRGGAPQSAVDFRARLRQGCLGRDDFNSQYLCIPSRAAGNALIAPEDLAAARRPLELLRADTARPEFLEPAFWNGRLRRAEPGGRIRYALGYDPARTGDLSALWLNRIDEAGIAAPEAVITLRNCRFETQKGIVAAIIEGLDAVVRGDRTGLGMAVCEELAERYPDAFEGLSFAAEKTALGLGAAAAFERGLQLLPEAYPEIAADLAGVRKSASDTGRLLLVENGNPLLPDSHNDLFWSLALAIRAAGPPAGETPCALEPAAPLPDFRRHETNFFEPNRMVNHENLQKQRWF